MSLPKTDIPEDLEWVFGIQKSISVVIRENMHIFRYASEMWTEGSPKEQEEVEEQEGGPIKRPIGREGLRGEIILPLGLQNCDYRVVFSTLPASRSGQRIHPCMLHVSVMDKNSKAIFGTKMKEPKDWRVVIEVESGQAYYRPNYGTNEKFKIDCVKNGRIILGTNGLQVTS